jgi:hypothetical protein
MRVPNFLIFLLLLISASVNAFAQDAPKSYPVISHDTHRKVLDILFPLDVLKGGGNEFALVLRYMPSFESESQIVIVGRSGKVLVTEYSSMDGNIYSKLNRILAETSREDPLGMSKMIRVKKRELIVPLPDFQKWRRGLVESIGAALKPKQKETATPPAQVSVVLDGTFYELWDYSDVISGAGELHYSVYGSEVSKPVYRDESPFIGWMKMMRNEIGKRS